MTANNSMINEATTKPAADVATADAAAVPAVVPAKRNWRKIALWSGVAVVAAGAVAATAFLGLKKPGAVAAAADVVAA